MDHIYDSVRLSHAGIIYIVFFALGFLIRTTSILMYPGTSGSLVLLKGRDHVHLYD